MAKKQIKGGLITITDETVKVDTDLEVTVTEDQINNASNQNIYLELDLTTSEAKAVNIILPEITTLKGQLGFCIWINDKGGTSGIASLTVTCSGADTTSGQTSVTLNSKGSGILLSPVGNSSWGTFYTQNVSSKLADVDSDEKIPLFKPKA